MKPEVIERWHRRRFLIPNAVTVANLFCGFISIIYSASGRYEKAAIAIGIAILLDGLDGRLARRFNATSKFGVEFDSLSDFISFGIAPAMLMYQWCFRVPADEFGVTVSFLYCLAAAGRLARFNLAKAGALNFEGMPTPGAAGMVAAIIHFFPEAEPSRGLIVLGTVTMTGLAFLMISTMEFFSVKRIKVGEMTKFMIVFLGFFIAMIWYDSARGFLALACLYTFSGPIAAIRRKMKGEAPVEERKVVGGQ